MKKLNPSSFIQGYWRLSDWAMSAQDRLRFIERHLELGIDTVDLAAIYGPPSAESLFGEALSLKPKMREKLHIISKGNIYLGEWTGSNHANHYNTTAEKLIESVETSLQRLGTEYLDTFLIHRLDYLLDVDEVAGAFQQLREQGKVRDFGVSNFNSSQFSLLQSRLDYPLITNQVEINPLNLQSLEDGTLDQLQELGRRPMAWSPLAGGQLLGGAVNMELVHCLQEVAGEIEAEDLSQVIFGWILKLPSKPRIILGTQNEARIKLALESEELSLTNEQWYRIWSASKGYPVP